MRRRTWLALIVAGAVGGATAAHLVLDRTLRFEPPPLPELPHLEFTEAPGPRRYGASWATTVGGVSVVKLAGTPAEIGRAHSVLLRDAMLSTEAEIWKLLETRVPVPPARWLLLDLGRLRYRAVDRGMAPERLLEIAAGARALEPDPLASRLPTYSRLVLLNALYDISLSFEHSPLLGCTSFVVSGRRSAEGGALLGRNFDFDVHPVFDDRKVLFLVHENGRIPFASVAWPGLVGVVSGMNLHGLAGVVHGARAGTPATRGEPVVHALRRLLAEARSVAEALALLDARPPMVSHLLVLADASGRSVAVERVPGAPSFVRELGEAGAVSNHLEGPSAEDPANRRIRAATSTLARRARAEELLAAEPGAAATPAQMVAWLRDRRAEGGGELPLGDRRAIDALIATHAVVLSTQTRMLWVSVGPALVGGFAGFDLRRAFEGPDPPPGAPDATLEADREAPRLRHALAGRGTP